LLEQAGFNVNDLIKDLLVGENGDKIFGGIEPGSSGAGLEYWEKYKVVKGWGVLSLFEM